MAAPRPAALVFIWVTVGLDMLALGLVLPVLPRLVEAMLGGDTEAAARMMGLFGTGWALMQFLAMPVLGALSDRFGRRPVVVLSNLGTGLDYLLMALAPGLALLFAGRLVSGVTAASVSTSFAYVADVFAPEQRAKAFGRLGAAFGLGFVLGPALGGLLGAADPRLPFWVAGALSLANAAYGWLVLPESLPPERRAPFAWRRANPVAALALLRGRAGLLGLAMVQFLAQLAHIVLPSVTVLYMGHRFGWTAVGVGLAMASVGVCSIIVQGVLVGPAVARLGERRAMLLGLLGGSLGFLGYGLAPSGAWFLACLPVISLWGIGTPALQALMTRLVPPDAQGRLLGANSSLQGIAGLIGPGLYSTAFALSLGAWSGWAPVGLPMFLASALVGSAALLGAWLTRATRA